jgi:LPS export ABC transporter protein LptC
MVKLRVIGSVKQPLALLGALLVTGAFCTCSFNYGDAGENNKNRPDIVMEDLEYVRVRGGDPLMRLAALHGERWEDRHVMELKEFSFEQIQDHGETINAEGKAGTAVVQLDSGDVSLANGVRIRVNSEDFTLSTFGLEWKDKGKTLTGGADDEVDIQRSDGTSFTGRGFIADARNRTWAFSGQVKGLYVEKDDKKENTITVREAAGPAKDTEAPEPTGGEQDWNNQETERPEPQIATQLSPQPAAQQALSAILETIPHAVPTAPEAEQDQSVLAEEK